VLLTSIGGCSDQQGRSGQGKEQQALHRVWGTVIRVWGMAPGRSRCHGALNTAPQQGAESPCAHRRKDETKNKQSI
jgi:hypothetical protein